jgi:hypothetical protein
MLILPPAFTPMRTPSLVFGNRVMSTAAAAAYSGAPFSALDIGTPSPDRIVFFYVAWRHTTPQTLSAFSASGSIETGFVTNGGISTANDVGIFLYAKIPTGTTTDIAASLSGSVSNFGVGYWISRGIERPSIPYDFASTTTDDGSIALDIPNRGFGLSGATVVVAGGGGNVVWTGFTEDFDTQLDASDNITFSGASITNAGGIIANQACSANSNASPTAGFQCAIACSFR